MTRRSPTALLFCVLVQATLVAGEVPQGYRDPSPFAFGQGDMVAIVGNGLADRMQHDGWMETALQGHLSGKMARFRNMSVSGDRPEFAPRSKGFTVQEDYLRHIKADVIFAFFGYNESFDGIDRAPDYTSRLVSMVERLREARPNGNSPPRIVLFSPIAFENLNDPNLPDGAEHNSRLKAYTKATRRAAEKCGVAFVDLFEPTLRLMISERGNLTINGVHLTEEGNRRLAEVIATRLLRKPVKVGDVQASLRKAVLDKNWHWHNRYRALDGNDIWGNRSVFTYVDGQSNSEVLRHELTMLDVMTANRDRKIWAVAAGRPHEIDDRNVPPPRKVISNVGGRSKGSNRKKEGSADYLSPEESLATIRIPDGYALNVFASEKMFPGLVNTVQMQVDGKGRIWVASWATYPKWEPLEEMKDSLVILEDRDRDGVADTCKVFAKVHCPTGFEFWNGGVLVASGSELLFLKDTDGDDVADVRYSMLQGLGSADTHHAANNLTYGPDGNIYWQSGIFLVNHFESPWGKAVHTAESALFRFHPRTFAVAPHAKNDPNPHGLCFDQWGYMYAQEGSGARSYQVRPYRDHYRLYTLFQRQFRPSSANELLSSDNFPEELQNSYLTSGVIGFLGVKQYHLHRDGYQGRKPGHVRATPGVELLNSRDRNFRPADMVIGEDGALYVSDWHNRIVGHAQHAIRDPSRDVSHGRVFRLVHKKRPLQKPVPIDGQPIAALLENLKHPVYGVRHRTRIELSKHPSDEVIEAALSWSREFGHNDEGEARFLLEVLWLHQQHNRRNGELLKRLLSSKVDHAAMAADAVRHAWDNVEPLGRGVTLVDPIKDRPSRTLKVPRHFSTEDKLSYKVGAEVYAREAHCVTCHQDNGLGMEKVYPPLVGSRWVTGNEERLIKLTLHGLWGKMEVKGKVYDTAQGVPPMTAFGSILSDYELAAVLTYVRNTWGNKAPPVEVETVKKVRAATRKRSVFWTAEELLKEHPRPDRSD